MIIPKKWIYRNLPIVPRPPVPSPEPPAEPTPTIIDRRPVDPTRRLGAPPSPALPEIVRAAHALGIDPRIAAALAIVEDSHDYGQVFAEDELPLTAVPQYVAERALRHLRERAAVAGPSFMRQLQAYNGLGRLAPGHYGQSRTIDAGTELPYSRRIIEVLQDVIPHSPEVLRPPLMSPAVSALVGLDWQVADDIAKDLAIRRRRPGLLRLDR